MSRIYLTLDYEFFFGARSGSVERCMIEPTRQLIEIGRARGVRFTFFVDAGMLYAMAGLVQINSRVNHEYTLISNQLKELVGLGHSVQLHIHPHWEDSEYVESGWSFSTKRYRLAHFDDGSALDICEKYYAALADIVGAETIRAYRAGGWCIQPFSQISDFLKKKGVQVDSSVFVDGYLNTDTHYFDFRSAPRRSKWRFEEDPLVPCENGSFLELPMSVVRYSRFFYLKMVFSRLLNLKKYRFWGDGAAIGGGRLRTFDRILNGDVDVLTLDGARSNVTFNEVRQAVHDGSDRVIISHPKALCDKSFLVLDRIASSFGGNFTVV